MTGRSAGRVVVVTGGASGIGRATALALAREGARVVVGDVDAPGGQATAAAIKAAGGEASALACDVSVEADVAALVRHAVSGFGRLDGAFNNAGIEGVSARTVDCDARDFDRVVAVNLRGVFLCMKHEIPALLASGGGAIVNNASVAALTGFFGAPAYAASKHGVLGLTRTAALEYARKGIRVNAVCPGTIQTPMVDRFTRGDREMVAEVTDAHPVGRLGKPEEVAGAVVWLLSDAASFVTGAALPVDGGFLAQ